MNGIELARLARKHNRDMRVLVISANAPSSALPDGVKFFSKPFYSTTLLREATG